MSCLPTVIIVYVPVNTIFLWPYPVCHGSIVQTVIIQGGYDCDYSSVTGMTTINGDITVTNGTVTLDNVELQ